VSSRIGLVFRDLAVSRPARLARNPDTLMVVNTLKTAVLMAMLGGLLVLLGYWFGGATMALIALGIAVVLNFGVYFFSDKLALRAARAVPVEELELPNVYSIVRSLAQRENMPMPAIYVIESPQPNAFATGRSPKHAAVAVTRGILELMNYQELEGVLAHELSHVKNRDILIATIAATLGAALTFLARIALWGGGGNRRNSGGIGIAITLVAWILAPLAAALIQFAISRSREFQADKSGAEMTGSPLVLASALEKLGAGTARIPMQVNPAVSQLFIADPMKAFSKDRKKAGTFAKLFSTHPPIEERVERLTQTTMGIR
jgi:heat shock protein HtpX